MQTSLREVVQDQKEEQQDKKELMRIVAGDIDLYSVNRGLSLIFKQVLLDMSPSFLVIHRLDKLFEFLFAEPEDSNDTIYQSLRIVPFIEDSFVDELCYLPEIDGVIEMIVDFEEGMESVKRQGISRLKLN